MDKLKMRTPDLTDKNIERIASLFPNVITETKDESGAVKKAIDFDLLKQALSKALVEDDNERYRLDWPGKKASLLKANTPIIKTLRPFRKESVNFDTTGNLYIEGDNFEVLKILQESYLGKVKMIYIDPPYNTGNDFIYKDDFAKSEEAYEEELGATDEEGGKLFRNTDSNGRFHSDWLSMMYERLVVARDLLKDDGVIFISIDDNEVHNLRKICDEILGANNYINSFCWVNNLKGRQISGVGAAKTYEHILCYSKNNENFYVFKGSVAELKESMPSVYKGFDYDVESDSAGEYVVKNELYNTNSIFNESTRPNLVYNIHYNPTTSDIKFTEFNSKNKFEGYDLIKPKGNNDGVHLYHAWRWGKDKISKEKNDLKFVKDGSTWKIYTKIREHNKTILKDILIGLSANGSDEVKDLFNGKKYFDFPKPVDLIQLLLSVADKNDLVIDFFSGSATTAQAVMQLNAEDGGNRKFIMVQLPEKTNENSEAYKAGYKTIADIGKERIRRAGKKIVEELKTKNKQLELGQESVDASKLDIGFRVYKTDDTNMKDVFYHPAELDQKQLAFLESNVKEDRTPEDLLTQVIIDLGLELSLPVETKKMLKNTVFIVQTNALVACFDNDIDFKIVDIIANLKPFKVVFKDASFKDDKDRINVEERFKRLSSETKVTVI